MAVVRSASVDLLDASSGRLLYRIPGLSLSILYVEFSPDGRYLAVNEAVACREAWDCTYQTRLFRISGGAWVSSAPAGGWIGFSAQGELLFFSQPLAEPGCAIYAWEEAGGSRLLREFRSAPDCRAQLSPDGKFLAVYLPENRVRVLALPDLRIVGDFPTTSSTRLAYSPDGRWLATFNELQLNVWRISTGSQVFEASVESLGTLAFNAQGTHLLGFGDTRLHLWQVESGFSELELRARSGSFSQDGRFLVIQSRQEKSQLYTYDAALQAYSPGAIYPGIYPQFAASGDLLAVQESSASRLGLAEIPRSSSLTWVEPVTEADHPAGQGAYIPRLLSSQLDPSGTRLLTLAETSTDDGQRILRVWDARAGTLIWQLADLPRPRSLAVSFAPDGLALALAVEGQVTLYDLAGSPLHEFAGAQALAFSPTGDLLATGAGLWELETGMLVLDQALNAAAFSDDGSVFAAGAGSEILLYQPPSDQPFARLRAYRQPVTWLGFAPGGSTLASLGRDGVLRLWDLSTNEPLWWRRTSYNASYGYALDASFAPDGGLLALGRLRYPQPGTLALWDMQGGVQRELGSGYAFRQAFSPDGSLLLVGSATPGGSLLQLYTTQDWQVLWSARSRLSTAPLVAFAPDGERFAAVLGDGVVVTWKVEDQAP